MQYRLISKHARTHTHETRGVRREGGRGGRLPPKLEKPKNILFFETMFSGKQFTIKRKNVMFFPPKEDNFHLK